VNLGAWLVLEKWMTPGLFAGTDAIDEYTFMQTPGAREKLRDHQKNFIREEDFKWMANAGVEVIRIPVGYWIFEGDNPYVPCIGRLDWAFVMAEKYGIRVLVCLHGAPGSQNGRDHSGKIGPAGWYENKAYRIQTVETLVRLAARYRDHPMFWGLELLNEPKAGIWQWKLRKFYKQAYLELAAILTPLTRVVFHDAFTPRLMSGVLPDTETHPVAMDIHWYHFAFWLHKHVSLKQYYRLITWHGNLIRRLKRWRGIIIGEWNGIIAGKILDAYPKEQHESIIREHVARQLAAYQESDAWFYWSYKTEKRGVWHFRSQVEDGIITLETK
jgi:glucan 1,3-beta-glucosidase